MFIRIGIRKTGNTDDLLGSGTKLLLPSLSLGFRHEKRETQFFYVDCSSTVSFQLTDSTNACVHPAVKKLDSPRPGPKNQLASSKFKSQLTAFIQNHLESQPITSGHDVIHIPSPIFYLGFLLWHLWFLHPLRARAWTPALMSAPTHALSRKVLSLTKPKDKICKTKNDNIKKILPQLYNRCDRVLCKEFGCNLQDTFRLISRAITMAS